jgi:hypothetical protein
VQEVLYDRIEVTSTTTGLGAFVLLGATPGNRPFSIVPDGDSIPYCITNNIDYEMGLGTVSAGGSILSRDKVLSSTAGGAFINWPAGTKEVFLTATSDLLTQINVESTLITREMISGGRAVNVNTSGLAQIAMAGDPTRMPAIGVMIDNTLSGQPARIYTRSHLYSDKFSYSGYIGSELWVGTSGDIVTSGGISGNVQQILGVVIAQSGIYLSPSFQVPGTTFSLTSGIITSGFIGDNAVNSGNISSGQVGQFHLASGAVNSGHISSGAVQGFFGSTRHIASGTLGVFDFGSGAVIAGAVGSGAIVSGNIASGQVGQFHISSGAVTSGRLGVTGTPDGTKFLRDDFTWATPTVVSGAIQSGMIASGAVQGFFGSTRNIASGTVGVFDFGSGAVIAGTVGSGAIVSGNIASGQVGQFHLASGAVNSGHIGNNAVVSGSIASGQVNTYHFGSGATVTRAQFVAPFVSGTPWTVTTEETISGVRAVAFSQSGNLVIAMAGVSGRGPAIGIVVDNVASGTQANVYTVGPLQFTSGLGDYSGYLGQPLYVGRSGQIVTASGSFNSGGFLSGDTFQQIGYAWTSGGALIGVNDPVISGGVPSLTSGLVQSGNIASGAVQGFFGSTRNIASGTVGVFDFGSGAVIAGTVGSGAIVSGNIASGQIGQFHIASGAVNSGHIGNNAVVSGSIASGQIGQFHIASGAVNSGHIASGAVQGFFGSTRNIASGTIGVFDFGSGAVIAGTVGSGAIVSGNIASGQVGQFHISSGAVTSGRLGVTGTPDGTRFLRDDFVWATPTAAGVTSGGIQSGMIASGAVQGFFGSTRHIASGTVGVFDFGSGAVIAGTVGSGAIVSGNIASGQIGQFHLASGAVNSGHIGNNAVVSGSVASGQLSTYHFGSGATVTRAQFVSPFVSGTSWTAITEETISGVRAVAFSQSGNLRIAMASVSGRGPAIGVVIDNVLSGLQANVYTVGAVQFTSGLGDYSGYIGQPLYVGRSGQVVTASGSFNSGGFLSGEMLQQIGVAWTSGGALIGVNDPIVSGSVPALTSGLVQSGNIASGAVQGFFGSTRNIASGTVGVFDFGSGAVIAGTVGSGAIVSGNIASGQIGQFHLASGSVTSGAIASGQVGQFAHSSGAINSGHVSSGAVQGFFGSTRHIASGTIGVFDFGSGAVIAGTVGSGAIVSGNIASGQVGNFAISSGAVTSGRLGVTGTPDGTKFLRDDFTWSSPIISGSIQSGMIASGAVQGFFGSTRNIASGTVGVFDFGSGAVIAGTVGSGAIVSGNIASGQIGQFHLASGAVNSGHIGNNAVVSGSVASGQLSIYHFASGATVTRAQFVAPFVSGTSWTVITEETISGVRAVAFSQSGTLRVAMASISGRYPAIGVVVDNVLSGLQANVYTVGPLQFTSGLGDYSGYLGQPLYVGRSGQVVTASGSFNSGGLLSGDMTQQIGFAWTSGGALIEVNAPFVSGGVPALTSGLVQSGNIASGAVQGFFGSTRNIASGTVGVFDFGSGAVIAGTVGSGAIVSGNIASGQIGQFHLASGSVTSGAIASGQVGQFAHSSGSVTSGAIASGQVGQFAHSSGAINSGHVSSGAVQGFFGSTRHIASGTVGVFDFGSGAVIAGTVGSGAIVSGNIASGQVGQFHLSSGSVTSGAISSGVVGQFALSSGSVTSGAISSGQVNTYHFGSGATVTRAQFVAPFVSGTSWTVITEEIISGVRAVALSQSGTLRVAMASISGRYPAIGVVVDNVLSGLQANVYTVGPLQFTSGLGDYSGYLGQPLYVGRSGQVVTSSGSFNSGGLLSGDMTQQIGYAWTSGGALIEVNAPFVSGSVPSLTSGLVQSGNIASGAVQGFFGSTRNIASGTVGVFDFGSGAVIAGTVGSGAIVSGNIASGQIGQFHLASGSVTSGAIASGQVGQFALSSGSVTSGAIASGQVGQFAHSSGAINSGHVSSGAVQGFFGSTRHIASGTVGVFDFGSGAVIAGTVGSGAIVSGNIASGQVGQFHLSSGSVTSGAISSGVVGQFALSSGSVTSGAISSGQVNTYHFGSGATVTRAQFVAPFVSGTSWTIITEETISGVKAVALSQSGTLRVAMASISGRYPAIGVVVDNVLSGLQANVYTVGPLQFTSGLGDYSGYIGQPLYVGRSGQVVTSSGSFNSGGLLSGDMTQQIGFAWTSGGALIEVNAPFVSGGTPTLTSGIVQSGNIGSGAVQGFFGSTRNIASGTVGVFDFGSGAVIAGTVGSGAIVSGNIASGQIGQFHLASGSVTSGAIASGQVGQFALSSGSVTSGAIASGQISQFKLASGAVNSGHIGSGAVQGFFGSTRHIASGTVGVFDFGSGAVIAGTVGSGAIVSGNVASGQIADFHFASGAKINVAGWITDTALVAGTPISGSCAVSVDASGHLIQSNPTLSGQFPIYGIADGALVSGSAGIIRLMGPFTSTEFNFSGSIGRVLYVGLSGQITPTMPSLSGVFTQKVGIATSHSGMLVRIDNQFIQIGL